MQITIREPGSALTHFIAMLMAAGAGLPLLIKAGGIGAIDVMAMFIFILSMVLLYGASTTYHAAILGNKAMKLLRKLDHAMIFVLIAGSYTPVCILVLPKNSGLLLLSAIWIVAIIGIVFKMLWINCPKWLSSTMYISMGWMVVLVFGPVYDALSPAAFGWLLAGGIIYTLGGIIYALKLPIFNNRHPYFGSHEIFHLFVMAGSFCHFIFMYQYVLR